MCVFRRMVNNHALIFVPGSKRSKKAVRLEVGFLHQVLGLLDVAGQAHGGAVKHVEVLEGDGLEFLLAAWASRRSAMAVLFGLPNQHRQLEAACRETGSFLTRCLPLYK